MQRLFLVRHAPAEDRDPERWPGDVERPLSDAGTARFRKAARGLLGLVPSVDVVLSSGYTRAWQTAELLADAGWPQPQELRELEVRVPPIAVVGALRGRHEAAIALVGHEPQLSRLASLLATGDDQTLQLELKKGTVVALEAAAPVAPGCARLLWTLPPKALRAIGS